MKTDIKKAGLPGKLIALIIVLIIVAAFLKPSLLFFLGEKGQAAVQSFTDNYLSAFQPLKDAEGSFDFLRVLALIIEAAACWVVNTVIQFIIRSFKAKTRRGNTIKSLFASLIKYIIVIYGIIYALAILGFNVGAVIASLGVLGLIIGFGAQSLIEDVITGLFIVMEGQLQVGDIVAIDDWRGEVTNIGIRTTTIEDTGNNARIVNNSDIRNLVNLSNEMSKAVVQIAISYDTDLVETEKVILAFCEGLPAAHPEIFKTAPVYMGVEELGESGIELKIAADVEELNIYNAKHILNRELLLTLRKNGIDIAHG